MSSNQASSNQAKRGATGRSRFGHRHEIVHNIQGSPFNQDTPLEAEDFLNPEPGDVFYHGEQHDTLLRNLRRSLETVLRSRPSLTVLSQVKLHLPAPAAHHPMPDLVVVENIHAPARPRASFDATKDAGTIRAVIEITSPLFAEYDLVHKRTLYAAAKVPEYVILDSGPRADAPAGPPALYAFHLHGAEYLPIEPSPATSSATAQRIHLPGLGLAFALADGEFQLIDPATDAPVASVATDADDEPSSLSDTQAAGRFRAQSIASQLKLD